MHYEYIVYALQSDGTVDVQVVDTISFVGVIGSVYNSVNTGLLTVPFALS